ncbi:MAG: hypothetical protein V8Q43_05190 [Christensenellaceae bacterium]
MSRNGKPRNRNASSTTPKALRFYDSAEGVYFETGEGWVKAQPVVLYFWASRTPESLKGPRGGAAGAGSPKDGRRGGTSSSSTPSTAARTRTDDAAEVLRAGGGASRRALRPGKMPGNETCSCGHCPMSCF